MIGLREDTGSPPPSPRSGRAAAALVARAFAEGGWLQSTLGLEHRPGQEQMARAVARAVATDDPLVFEAGTGVGKSLAYLIPGLVHAVDETRPLIVSTHTIALQEQLETKDLPLVRRFFEQVPELKPYAGFRAALLVGKGNYLCTTRLAAALKDRASLFADADYDELKRIATWAETSQTGIRHELKPPPRAEVWEAVNADSSSCSRKYCDCERCFYQRARARLRGAHVVIVNHALLFALINAGGARAHGGGGGGGGAPTEPRGVLFPDDSVVLDEAHTVPEVATENFGLSLSSYGVDRALKFLHNPRTGRGLLRKLGDAATRQLVEDALEGATQFFGEIGDRLLAQRAIVRLRDPDPVECHLEAPLRALDKALAKIADQLEEGRVRDDVLDQRQRLRGILAGLRAWLSLGEEGHVYWCERSGRRQTIVTLRSAPIDIAPELRRRLFGCGTSVVCTSATLAIGGELAAFQQRVGADDATASAAPSPFDYERHVRVFVAADMPLPAAGTARLAVDALIDWVRFCVLRVRGGSLVLFTSYTDLRAVAAALAPDLIAAGRPLLVQGEELSRTELAREMRARGNAVLLGTESFWTGIDVPGDALAQVIVTRLPFDPPTHPILEARAEAIRDRGGNPFNELTLPDAIIKFRQGVGRLIRSKTDRGLITLLDSRVLAKSYGRLFLDALPVGRWERLTAATRAGRFQPFA